MNTCVGRARHVVLVHGLLGWGPGQLTLPGGPVSYWETAVDPRSDTGGLTVLEAGVGPVSSQHDRACELYAQIRGQRTDYGVGHSSAHGHERWGADFTGHGLHPGWCAERPIHLVGHSAGGNTARELQRLLADDYWAQGTSPDWVRSITCLASPLNGSPAAYMFGCDQSTGLFRWPSLVAALARMAPRFWRLEHWGLADSDMSSPRRLRSSGFLSGIDNLAYDVTMQGCAEANRPGRLDDWPATYYMSCVARCTVPGAAAGSVSPSRDCRAFLQPSCAYLCSKKSGDDCLRGKWSASVRIPLSDPDWQHNDGLVPVASQRYPLLGGRDVAGEATTQPLQPGRWYYEEAAGLVGPPELAWDHADFTVLRGPLLDLVCSADSSARRLLLCGRRGRRRSRRDLVETDADDDPDAEAEDGGMVSRRMQRLFYERLFRRLSGLP